MPEYLSDYFIKNNQFQSYDTRRKDDIHLPTPKLSLGKRKFRCSQPTLFNLPQTIKQIESLQNSKHRIKIYKF